MPIHLGPSGLERGRGLPRALGRAVRRPSARSPGQPHRRQYAAATHSLGSGNTLAQIIHDTIRATGPLSVARYMQFCLAHPTEGYYAKGDVFGAKGDFITSPEISQVFGELVAIWLLTRYMAAGSPKRCRLVELGPGRGTLMDDVLRTLSVFPIFPYLTSIHLIENSLALQAAQRAKLAPRLEGTPIELLWSDKIEDVPLDDDAFTMVLAHEFFDAMPINVFEKREQGWREVMIASSPSGAYTAQSFAAPIASSSSASSPSRTSDSPVSPRASILLPFSPSTSSSTSPRPSASSPLPPSLAFSLASASTPLSTVLPATSPRFAKLPIGSRIEVAQDSWRIMRRVGELVGGRWSAGGSVEIAGRGRMVAGEEDGVSAGRGTEGLAGARADKSAGGGLGGGGAALVIDYGGDRVYGQSFRAFKNHKIVDVFDSPGEADLTANVDFAYLGEAVADLARPLGPIPQSRFLLSLGLQPRLDKLLAAAKDERRKADLEHGAKRLVDELGMGGQYRVLGVVPMGKGEGEAVYPFEE